MVKTSPAYVNRNEMTRILGIAPSQFDTYKQAGMPGIGIGRGRKYDVTDVIKWLVTYSIAQTTKLTKKQLLETGDEDWGVRRLAAQALREELELEKERGVLVNVEDAQKELNRNFGAVRAALLSFPSRASPYCVGITDELTMRETLDKQIEILMESIIKSLEVDAMDALEDEQHEDSDESEEEE